MITLKTLPQATAQQVFDQVVAHARAQGDESMDNGRCKYRSAGGLKCFAGCLIADDEYDREMMESSTWNDLVDIGLVPIKHNKLIRALQRVHDHYEVHGWETALIAVADAYGLIHTPAEPRSA